MTAVALQDRPAAEVARNPIVLETSGLTKAFGAFLAVEDVDIQIRRNTIHALIGPNGAGKSTVFNLITKFLKPTRGRIVFEGSDITDAMPTDLAARGIARSFQTSAVFPNLTVLENVRVALQRPLGNWFHFWSPESRLEPLNGRAEEFLESVDLLEFRDWHAAELPYGRKRALEIATTLALNPTMLLLDEPMAGLGREDIRRISELIRHASANRTVLMVEHNLSVVSSLCDRVTVLTRGKVLAEGSYTEIASNAAVRHAYMGTAA